MSEFGNLIKEAFVGLDEPPDGGDVRGMEEALRGFERRERLVRVMGWIMVSFMSVLWFASVVLFLRVPEDGSVKELVGYAALFVYSGVGIGIGKMLVMWFQNHTRVMVELKRLELRLAEAESAGR